MSFARSFAPSIFRPRWSAQNLSRQFSSTKSVVRPLQTLNTRISSSSRNSAIWKAVGITGCSGALAFTLQAWSNPIVQCQGNLYRLSLHPAHLLLSAPPSEPPTPTLDPSLQSTPPPTAKPFINVYELSFGTVAGICTGVFVKKGLKTVAFFLGGFFVVIQVFPLPFNTLIT